jgi:hypothetical protein
MQPTYAVAVGAVWYGRHLKDLSKQFQDRLAEASSTAEENLGFNDDSDTTQT